MGRKLYLLLLALCLAVVFVKSETKIEVDENGDEYEVKKFNIQSRQLTGGPSQCVVTRRKRATSTVLAVHAPQESEEDNNSGYELAQPHAMLFYAPQVLEDDEDADDDFEDSDNEANDGVAAIIKAGDIHSVVFAQANDDGDDYDDEEDDDTEGDDEDDGPNTIEVVHIPQFPVIGQIHSEGQTVAAIAEASALEADQKNSNDIVLVQGNEPPKVNPQTHAVFELLPVNQQQEKEQVIPLPDGIHVIQLDDFEGEDLENEYDDNEDEEDFHYNEEASPVTTTAIWSTGVNDSDDAKPAAAQKPSKNKNVRKNKRRRNRWNKNKRGQAFRRPNRNGVAQMGNKRRPMNVRPNANGQMQAVKRRRNKNKISNNGNRVSKPKDGKNKRKKQRKGSKTKKTKKSKKTKKTRKTTRRTKKKKSQKSKKKSPKKSKKKKTNKKKKKNTPLYYSPTSDFDDFENRNQNTEQGGNVNCIFIRKDGPPTTTTPRPFWDLLGRSANGAPRASGLFGHRKRTNLRLVA